MRFNIKNGEELTEIYFKSDVILLTCVFEIFVKVSVNEFGINPLNRVSLPDYAWQCGLNYTGKTLQTLQDKDMILLFENSVRGGSIYVKSDEKNNYCILMQKLYMVTLCHNRYCSMKLKFDKNFKLGDIVNTPDNIDIGYFVEVDLSYSDNIKKKTKNFPFACVNKKLFVIIFVIF